MNDKHSCIYNIHFDYRFSINSLFKFAEQTLTSRLARTLLLRVLKLSRLQLSRLQYNTIISLIFPFPFSASYFVYARNNDPLRTLL